MVLPPEIKCPTKFKKENDTKKQPSESSEDPLAKNIFSTPPTKDI